MASTTVRIQESTHATLRELAAASGRSLQDVLAEAVDLYRRKQLLDETNAAYARLRASSPGWEEELAKRRAWEATLTDGLADG
jgi:predicted transcriptional regulator